MPESSVGREAFEQNMKGNEKFGLRRYTEAIAHYEGAALLFDGIDEEQQALVCRRKAFFTADCRNTKVEGGWKYDWRKDG